MIEGRKKRIWRLRSRQRELTVDDEERHTVHAKTPFLVVSRLHRTHSFIAIESTFGPLAVQSCFDNNVNERLANADVPALSKVGAEQRLHDGILSVLLIS
jgi:hypothetical protein